MSLTLTALIIAASAAVLILYWNYQPDLAKLETVFGTRRIISVVWTGTKYYAFAEYAKTSGPISASSTDGVSWEYLGKGDSITGEITLKKVIWNGSKFLIIPSLASGGYVSTDAVTWTAFTLLAVQDVVWNGTIFCAIHTAGRVSTSTDGANWTTNSSLASTAWGTSSSTYVRIAWNGSKFCAAGIGGAAATSPDGVNWTYQGGLLSSGYSSTTMSIVWTGTKFFVVSSANYYATSADGITWVNGTTNLRTALGTLNGSVCYALGATIFVNYGGKITTSTDDGANWTTAVSLVLGTYQNSEVFIYTVAWNGSNYITAGSAGKVATSTDKITWTERKDLSKYDTCFGTSHVQCLAWNGSKFCVAAHNRKIATSTDGITWTYHHDCLAGTTVNVTAESNDIAASPSKFCLLTQYSTTSKLVTSPDGVNWTEQTGFATTYGTAPANSVIWTGTVFYVVGSSGKAASSPDGVTWTLQSGLATATTSAAMYSVAWNGSQFCCVGASGKVATSPDGVTWTLQTGLSGNPLWGTTAIYSVTWGNSKFCAVSQGGKVATSPDGVTWTYSAQLATLGLGTNITKVVFLRDMFYVLSGNANTPVIAVSSDGLFWELQTKLSETVWTKGGVSSGVWTGAKLLVAGDNGHVATLK